MRRVAFLAAVIFVAALASLKAQQTPQQIISRLEIYNVETGERKVVYITYMKGDVDPGAHPANKNVEIRIIPASGGEYKTLIKLFGGQGSFNVNSWAPDSKRFAFVSYEIVN